MILSVVAAVKVNDIDVCVHVVYRCVYTCVYTGVQFRVDAVNSSRVWLYAVPACLLHAAAAVDDQSTTALQRSLHVYTYRTHGTYLAVDMTQQGTARVWCGCGSG